MQPLSGEMASDREKSSRGSAQKEQTNHLRSNTLYLAEEQREGRECSREDDFDLKVKIKCGESLPPHRSLKSRKFAICFLLSEHSEL